jgi:hypothetical protein
MAVVIGAHFARWCVRAFLQFFWIAAKQIVRPRLVLPDPAGFAGSIQYALFAQARDLLRRVAQQAGQDVLGVRAEQRRRLSDFAFRR